MNSHSELLNLLNNHNEWLLTDAAGRGFALRRDEFELTAERGRVLLGFVNDAGWQTWRVEEFSVKREAVTIDLSRRFGSERERLRLVPRTAASEFRDDVELARYQKAERIARAALVGRPKLRLAHVSLNKENGRLAMITLERPDGRRLALVSDVTESMTPESLMTSALAWLSRLAKRRRNTVDEVWLAAVPKETAKLLKIHALLVPEWRRRIVVKRISVADDSERPSLEDVETLDFMELWRGKPADVESLGGRMSSATVERFTKLAPDAIDAVFSRHGETLRFHGLPFARIRSILGHEKIWFGAENPRRLLTPENLHEFNELFTSLAEFRRGDSPSRQHFLYRSAPEAWLESLLRRNIRLLDANLVLSPVYHQFRAERERVDLLALRRDGRLVIIEIKTETDRDMVFQAADYWRKLERLRRSGKLRDARLFGDLEIADKPAVCYLLAPTLSFHRDFEFLSSTLIPEIEIHRFNLAENWRSRLKVLDRKSREMS